MKYSASVVVIFTGLSLAVSGQTPVPQLADSATAPPQTTFRSATSMVALNVTVTDGRKLITGLNREDFEVYEDGVQQQVRFFEARSVPMDVILLLDTSSSMRDKMTVVHDAARGFMKMLRPEDRGAVVAFSDKVSVLQELTSDAAAIEGAISATEARGATALHNAIYVALKEFGRGASASGEVRRQAIAVLSDGEDTSSLVTFDDVVKLARKTGVNIYTITLQSQFAYRPVRDSGQFSQAQYSMRTLAKETGAQSFFPATVQELKSVYSSISDELEAQYSLAYAPTNPRADGRFRRIIVRVTSDPSLKPRARAGYTADLGRRAIEGPSQQLR